MADIKTRINPGDTVWWVHCSDKVYKGTVQAMTLCESQGALYCEIYSPSFRRNPYPVVHYSNVFPSRLAADEFCKHFFNKENKKMKNEERALRLGREKIGKLF